MGQAVITYSGRDAEGHHIFNSSDQKFVVEPFFPLNWQGNYHGLPLHTSASTGYITITAQNPANVYSIELPDILKDAGVGKNITDILDNSLGIISTYKNQNMGATIGTCTVKLHRVRGGTDTIVGTAQNIGIEAEESMLGA